MAQDFGALIIVCLVCANWRKIINTLSGLTIGMVIALILFYPTAYLVSLVQGAA